MELIDTTKSDKAQDKEKRKRERYLSDLRFVLKAVEGRRFIWNTLSECGVFRTTFTGEPNGTTYNEGRRTIGLNLLNDILEAKPESFTQMQDEYRSERKIEELKEKENTGDSV